MSIKPGDLVTYVGEPTLVPRVPRVKRNKKDRVTWGELPPGANCLVVEPHTFSGFWIVLIGENWYSIHERFLRVSVSL